MANESFDGTLEWPQVITFRSKLEQPQVLSPVAIAFVLSLWYIARKLFANRALEQFYESQPCAGRRPQQWFSWLRATLGSVFHNAEQVQEAYIKYGKRNIPFLVPSIRKGPVFVLSPGLFKSVLSTPENRLAARIPMTESISSKYTIRNPHVQPIESNNAILRKEITERLGSLAKDLSDEVSFALDQVWGSSKEWHSVVNLDSVGDIMTRVINRVIIPLPLCRNEDFLKPLLSYSTSILRDGIIIPIFPSFLQPVIGPLITWRGRRKCETCIKMLLPVVEERLELFKRHLNGSIEGWIPPNDILQMQIEQSHGTGEPEQLSPRLIAHRLVIFNFSNISPGSLTLYDVLLNIYSTPPSKGVVEILRQECNTVMKETPERYWSKDALSRLVLLDSTIRESMRYSDFGYTAYQRRVTDPKGLTVSPTLTIPQGVNIEVPVHSVHTDPDFHHNPTQFSPFRFAPQQALTKAQSSSPPSISPHPDLKANGNVNSDQKSTATTDSPPADYARSLVTLDPTFLGFGYRQCGCPGRFIAAHTMKLIVANILQHYDVEHMPERPSPINLMEFRVPRQNFRIRVRKRV